MIYFLAYTPHHAHYVASSLLQIGPRDYRVFTDDRAMDGLHDNKGQNKFIRINATDYVPNPIQFQRMESMMDRLRVALWQKYRNPPIWEISIP
jgi:hypothetical protein